MAPALGPCLPGIEGAIWPAPLGAVSPSWHTGVMAQQRKYQALAPAAPFPRAAAGAPAMNESTPYVPTFQDALDAAKGAGRSYALGCLDTLDAFALVDHDPLSGEWSDEPTPATVARAAVFAAGLDWATYSGATDALADAWLSGWDDEVQDALASEERQAERGNRGVLSYAYQAEEVSAERLFVILTEGDWRPSWITRGILAPAARGMQDDVEGLLDQAAAYLGLDRGDEHTFDSDDFPKVGRIAGAGWVA